MHARHNAAGDAWIVVDGAVYDVSKFAGMHPGGRHVLEQQAGRQLAGRANGRVGGATKAVFSTPYHPSCLKYLGGGNECRVYAKNRALVDVMRSVAHEMTHMMQDDQGLIKGHVQDIGGFHENQANSAAGALIKMFAKTTPGGRRIYE